MDPIVYNNNVGKGIELRGGGPPVYLNKIISSNNNYIQYIYSIF